jgi:uncharacterized repeat protein (TIGR01451 family)
MIKNDNKKLLMVRENGSAEQDRAARRATVSASPFLSVIVLVVSLSLFGWSFANPASAAIINEPMTNATAPSWVIGGTAYLTASGGLDPVGSGWLRLTDVVGNQAGSAFLDTAFDISNGVVIQFDYATWGGAGSGSTCGQTGADGYSVYLFDGTYNASTFVVGASGGSLGYDKKTVAPVHAGLTGGYLGVGIDEWGNFSASTEGRTGVPGVMECNGVAVRGPYNLPQPYNYIGGTTTPIGTLAFPGYLTRPSQFGADYRKVVIYITPVGSNPVTDMRIDVYMQLGYTSALTQVLSNLMLGSGPPNNGLVKIGYAASTGGSTNIHEIRNLVIDPLPNSNIDLGITKLAASPTVVSGGTVTYTVKVQNYGPTNVTAANVPITDTVPAGLSGVSWTCAGTGGAICSAATGTGNAINTSTTLPLNSYATYTIIGTVTAAAGTQLTNTATLTVPSGINDYNTNNNSASAIVSVVGPPVTVSGMVFNDNGAGGGTAHDGIKNGTEGSPNIAAIYAKLFRANDLTTTIAVVAVAQAAGTFSFANVPSYQNYTIILSSTNTVNVYDLSFPNPAWIFTKPLNYTLSNIAVSGVNLANQNFGVYNGTRYGGRVIRDNGYNGSLGNANDGVQNAAETGISGVTMSICNDGACTAIDTTTTDSLGDYALFIDYGNAFQTGTARITQTIPALNLMVSYNPGNATGTLGVNTAAGTFTTNAFARGTDVSGILFGDVLDNTFVASQAKNALKSNTVYYAHTFTPGTGGTVTFAQNSRVTAPAAPAWAAAVYYRDNNCNGTLDGGDTTITGSLTTSATVPICILTAVAVPATATPATNDVLVTRATFVFTNSIRPANSTYDVTDTTTVVSAPNLSTSTKTVVDLNGAPALPNDVLRYTIVLKETMGVLATGVTVTDNIPANVTGFSVVSFSSGTNSSTGAGTGANNTGYLNITNMSVAANGTATIVFDVTIANGTPAGTVINNTAVVTSPIGLSAAPAAPPVVVGPFVSMSGMVYSDANHNGIKDGGEVSSNVAGIYAKLFLASDLTTAVSVTPIVQASGAYTFNNVPTSKTYSIILSSTATNAFDPIFPGADWTYTSPVSYTLSNVVVALSNLVNLDFGVYNGSRINGRVLRDDGAVGGFALANNGIQDASEPGISGVTVKIALDTAPTGTLDSAVTDANGAFILYTNTPTAVLRIYEVANPAGYVSVNFDNGNTNGTYVMASDYILFSTYTRYTDYSGIIFSDVPDNTFAANQATNVTPANTVYYAHTFTPGSGGTVTFATNVRTTNPALPTWSGVVYYRDTTCNGAYDAGTDTVISGALAASVGTDICILAAVAIPTGATGGTTDALTIRATFTFTNSVGPVVLTYDVTDTTTVVGAAGAGNKPLYLYDSTSAYKLSRTKPSGLTGTTSLIKVTGTQAWSLTPALASGVKTIGNNVAINLWLASNSTTQSRTVEVRLACSSDLGTYATSGNITLTAPGQITTTPLMTTFNLTGNLPMTCSAYDSWRLDVFNRTTGTGTRDVIVYPMRGSNNSYVDLPSQNVINVDSVIAYDAAYPGGTALASFTTGTIYLRAVVSDPFGSYDIDANTPTTLPKITIKDPSGSTIVPASGPPPAMTEQVAARTASSKTFEYTYTIPISGPTGTWTTSVTAPEGTEGLVSHAAAGTFRMTTPMPSIVIVKSVHTYSDPINGIDTAFGGPGSAKAIPGASMQYTILVTNTGPGAVDNNTIVVTDPIPANTSMCVSTICGNPPVVFSCSVTPACGLTYNYAADVTYFDQLDNSRTPAPDADGYDALVRKVRINPKGVFNAAGGGNPYFNIYFKIKVQ